MPDEHGNFMPGFLAVRGRGGELRCGFRTMTELGRWAADIKNTSEDGKTMTIRLMVRDHDPDPFWMEHAAADEVVLDMRFGSREMSGPAKVVGQFPNLVIEATVEESSR